MNLKLPQSIFLILLMNAVFAQDFPPRAQQTPIKYITPREGVAYDISESRRPGSFWAVFSDRANNTTYANEKGRGKYKVIQFMDMFYVAEEGDKRVHLIKDPGFETGQFSSYALDYGWVDKDKLLLWDHCLVTKVGKINKKGMILNTIESIRVEDVEDGQEEGVVYCYDPELALPSNNKSRIYEILYIYKISENGKSILLGKTYSTDKVHAKDEILGWVLSTKITHWDHRIAVEPNWDMLAVAERKANKISAKFFVDQTRAKRYSECNDVANRFILWDDDTYEKRPIGTWRRFPLLDYDKGTQIIKAGVFTEIESISNNILYLPAYAPLYVECCEFPLFQFVLFLSLREFGNLLSKLDDLVDATSGSGMRAHMKIAWLELMQSHLGEAFSREKAENKTLEELNEQVFGLPGTSHMLKYYKLSSITDPSVVSDEIFYDYLIHIKEKRIELAKIFNEKTYKYSFYSYDTEFFWISEDLLP